MTSGENSRASSYSAVVLGLSECRLQSWFRFKWSGSTFLDLCRHHQSSWPRRGRRHSRSCASSLETSTQTHGLSVGPFGISLERRNQHLNPWISQSMCSVNNLHFYHNCNSQKLRTQWRKVKWCLVLISRVKSWPGRTDKSAPKAWHAVNLQVQIINQKKRHGGCMAAIEALFWSKVKRSILPSPLFVKSFCMKIFLENSDVCGGREKRMKPWRQM